MDSNQSSDESAKLGAEHALSALRNQIDAADRQLLALLNARARLAQEVGEVKKQHGLPVYRPEREAQVLRKISDTNPGPLLSTGLVAIWGEIMSACRALEKPMRVAFLGPEGTFSEMALRSRFGLSVEAVPCVTLDEVCRSAESGAVEFAVLPVENSSEGAVNRSLDLLQQSALLVSGEVSVPVQHCLMTLNGSLAGIKKICAHPQALAQCQAWLNQNAPGIERVPVSSNAQGAKLASESADCAGIAAESAALKFGLQIVAPSIQDDPLNRTRFLVIGKHRCDRTGNDQTSLILSVPDRAGAVHALIEPLARHGVSMKRFESRPARSGNWEYYFHIDVLGHEQDANVSAALAEIRNHSAFFKLLGSYPRAA
jgi:chorismate mutase / prephenate dehydratase